MSAVHSVGRPARHEEGADQAGDAPGEAEAPLTVTVRRNVAWTAPLATIASGVAVAYVWRAVNTSSAVDWLLCGVTAAIALLQLAGLLDARNPLLVADEPGLRIRLGGQWRGLPWDAVEKILVEPRKGRLRDGRILVLPHSLARTLDGLQGRARRQAVLNQRLYGAALTVPLGLVTRVSAAREGDIADRLAALSRGRADVLTLIERADEAEAAETVPQAAEPRKLPGLAVGLGAVSRIARGRSHDVDAEPASPEPLTPLAPAARAASLELRRRGVRADLTVGAAALDLADGELEHVRRLPEGGELRRQWPTDLLFEPVPEPNVRALAEVGDPVAPLVVDDFETQPAYDPVIGPELMAARSRTGLSVDQLAERTRIRPHVIESIEVDDFAPCGGDVYARGHLRTLARVLGQDPAPLLATFDNRYANAPISARRVFEAELATGSLRRTSGGANWSILVALVLVLVLVWGVARLIAGGPNEMAENPPTVPGSAAWPPHVYDQPKNAAPAVPTVLLRLVALNASTRVQVRNADGNVVFAHQLVYGETKTVRVSLPMKVSADNGGAVTVRVGKRDYGLLGTADKPVTREFGGEAAAE